MAIEGGRAADYVPAQKYTYYSDADVWGATVKPAQVSTPAYTPASYTPPSPTVTTATLDRLFVEPGYITSGSTVQGAAFTWRGARYIGTSAGTLLSDINLATGQGSIVGSLSLGNGRIWITQWAAGANPAVADWSMLQATAATGSGELPADCMVAFRTAAAPLRPGALQITGQMADGTSITATADEAGHINHARVKGKVDFEAGVADLTFCRTTEGDLGTADVSNYGIPGISTIYPDIVLTSTLRYNATAYEYIPVDPDIVGVDSVRLPSDGRVPIFQVGDYAVVHRSAELAPQTVTSGQTVTIGTERLSRIWITDATGADITYGWARDLDAGTVQILTPADWAQPVTIGYSIEHMALVRQLDISGSITLNRKLPHDFPAASSYISSALMLGDRYARVSLNFDQQTWDGITWLDYVSGNVATATYNTTAHPIEVDNTGAITERWGLRFTSATAYQVIGEHVGVVTTGLVSEDCAPQNPATGTPYFTIRASGWGSGWAAGNALRLNTIGAIKGFACVRAVQPGDYTSLNHKFALLARVNVDRDPSET